MLSYASLALTVVALFLLVFLWRKTLVPMWTVLFAANVLSLVDGVRRSDAVGIAVSGFACGACLVAVAFIARRLRAARNS